MTITTNNTGLVMDQLDLLLHQYGATEMVSVRPGGRPETINIIPVGVSFIDMPIWKNTMTSIAEEACYEAKELDTSVSFKIGGI